MNDPDDQPSAAPNPFESPALPLPGEPKAQAGGEAPERPVADPWERPTRAEMLTIVLSVFATRAIVHSVRDVTQRMPRPNAVAHVIIEITLAAVPLLIAS